MFTLSAPPKISYFLQSFSLIRQSGASRKSRTYLRRREVINKRAPLLLYPLWAAWMTPTQKHTPTHTHTHAHPLTCPWNRQRQKQGGKLSPYAHWLHLPKEVRVYQSESDDWRHLQSSTSCKWLDAHPWGQAVKYDTICCYCQIGRQTADLQDIIFSVAAYIIYYHTVRNTIYALLRF